MIGKRELSLVYKWLSPSELSAMALVCKELSWNRWRMEDQITLWLPHLLKNLSKYPQQYYKDAILKIRAEDRSKLDCKNRQDVQVVLQQTMSLSRDAMREDAIKAFKNKKPLKDNIWARKVTDFENWNQDNIRSHDISLHFGTNDVTQFDFFLNEYGDPQFNMSLLESDADVSQKYEGLDFYQGVIYRNCVIMYEGQLCLEITGSGTTSITPFGIGKLYDKWGIMIYQGQTTPSGKNGQGTVYYPDGKTPLMDSSFYCGQDEPVGNSVYYDDTGQKLPDYMDHNQYVAKRVKETHQCSYMYSRDVYITQTVFACHTCYASNSQVMKGCCISCSQRCHKGHNLQKIGVGRGFFCDCGAGELGYFDCCARTPCASGCQCKECNLGDSDNEEGWTELE